VVGQWWVGRSTRFAHKVVRRSHWYADRFTKNDGKTHLGSGALVREKHACVGHDVFFSTESTPTVSHDTIHTTHTTQTDVPCPRCTPAWRPPLFGAGPNLASRAKKRKIPVVQSTPGLAHTRRSRPLYSRNNPLEPNRLTLNKRKRKPTPPMTVHRASRRVPRRGAGPF
jgi:hypothetical protein